MGLGGDLLALPFAEVVAGLATGIAEAQSRMDRSTMDRMLQVVQALAAEQQPDTAGAPNGARDFVAALERLKAGGLLPTFYQFVDSEVEVRMAITTSTERELKAGGGIRLGAVTVDATYAQKYSYRGEGASVLRAKIVPVAPPEQLQALLRAANEHGLLDLKLPLVA